MPFFLALFVAYCISCIICVIIFILEHAFKPKINKMVQPRFDILKKQLDDKIEDLIKLMESEDVDALLLNGKTIFLLAELKAFIK